MDTIFSNFYYCMAALAYGIFILQFLLSQLFADVDVDIDLDAETDFDIGSLVSFKGLIHFMIGCFSWLSGAFYFTGSVSGIDWAIGCGIGLIFMVILYFVYKLTKKFQHIPETKNGSELVGLSGKVSFLTGDGAYVRIQVNGEQKEVKCINQSGTKLEAGLHVIILDYKEGNYYV